MKTFALLKLLLLASLLSSITPVETVAEETTSTIRELINLNQNWEYTNANTAEYETVVKERRWEAIHLPHTWNRWDVMDADPGYRRDAGWYRKDLTVSPDAGKRYRLYFEGANVTTEVYVNGQPAGGHVGGYVGFEVDVTDYLISGKNQILIRVDNGYNPSVIPSQKADFFIYGGITRDLWLKIIPATHLADVRFSTPEVSAVTGRAVVQTTVASARELKAGHIVRFRLTSPEGEVVADIGVGAVEASGREVALPPVINPRRWSPAEPHLYKLTVGLYEDGNLLDELRQTVGFRSFRFDPYGAFYLNDERLLLRGTHRHEEHAGYGAAMPNELHRRDVEQMKEMGVNFLRLGHYPQDPEVYRACNELGIIVWDELPWCRGGMGGAEWRAHTERLLREQITQNYNHPSVLFWSLGNEIYWLPDFPGGDDETTLNAFVTQLDEVAHELDPNRLTAIRKYYAGADLVDVFSPSIWSGWYAGVYTNYQKTLTKNQQKYPRFLHMEYGGSSHVGRHTETPITGAGLVSDDDWAEVANQVNVRNIAKNGDWTESYIVDLFDHYLSVTETQPDFAGNAQWAFKDFGTPLRPQNAIPYVNQKGLVDRAGRPKDAYYVFKSYWAEAPFAYIESHRWTHRRGPADKLRNIPVYSNAEAVELFQDGRSLGRKTRRLGDLPAGGLHWDVVFAAGPNRLRAEAYRGGELVAVDSMTVHYDHQQAGKPDRIELTHRELTNGHLLVEATVRDRAGLRVYDYQEEIYFSLNGNGQLLRHYGTPDRSDVVQMANGRAVIELVPGKTGRGVVEARNQDFKGSYLVLNFNSARE